MNQNDRLAWEDWAEHHQLLSATFGWRNRQGEHELTVRLCSYNEALAAAQRQGYQEPRWFKPWTWLNWVVTVG